MIIGSACRASLHFKFGVSRVWVAAWSCAWALQAVAANGFSECVSAVHCDVGLLERGREVRRAGANVAVADIFDAGAPPFCW